MFSLLDALMGKPMAIILTEMNLAPEVAEALRGEPTILGSVLKLARSYEQADWNTLGDLAAELALDENRLPALYREAVSWADSAAES